ncbi:MAG: hypothetical protein ACLTT7_06605, partial [Paraclostridium bifermentans]
IELTKFENIKNMDAVIVAVGHKEYIELTLESIKKLYEEKPYSLNSEDKLVLVDVKGIFDRKEAQLKNYLYWRL